MCSTEDSQKREIEFLKKIFRGQNGFPSRVIHDCIHNEKQKMEEENALSGLDNNLVLSVEDNHDPRNAPVEFKPLICLPYKGREGEKIISQFREAVSRALPPNVRPQFG